MNGHAMLGQDSDKVTVKDSEYMKGETGMYWDSVFSCLVSDWNSMPSHPTREMQPETSCKFMQKFQQTSKEEEEAPFANHTAHFVVPWRSSDVFL